MKAEIYPELGSHHYIITLLLKEKKKTLLIDSLGLKFYIIIIHIMVAPEGIS